MKDITTRMDTFKEQAETMNKIRELVNHLYKMGYSQNQVNDMLDKIAQSEAKKI